MAVCGYHKARLAANNKPKPYKRRGFADTFTAQDFDRRVNTPARRTRIHPASTTTQWAAGHLIYSPRRHGIGRVCSTGLSHHEG